MNFTKRIAAALASALMLALPAFAQETVVKTDAPAAESAVNPNEDYGRRVIVSRWYQNWEISAKAGTQAYLGEYVHCHPYFRFKDWWTVPAVDVSLSKWGTQSIGLALGFTYSPFKSLYSATGEDAKYASFAKPDDEKYWVDENFKIARGNMGNAYISVIFDLCNIFGGYKKGRPYNLVASIGGGMMFPIGNVSYKDICASFNAGLINKFNIGRHWSIDLAIRGTLHDDMFNGVSYYTSDDRRNVSVDATIGATLGFSYHFNWRTKANRKQKSNSEGWTTVNEIVQYTDPYKAVEQQAASASAAAAAATAALAAANEKLRQKENAVFGAVSTAQPFFYIQLVNFKIDKWDISNRENVGILFAAETIKAHPDVKFLVQGYADKQTSNPKHNQFLSENRVNAVYDALVNQFGVNPDQLIKSAHGGVDYMFFTDEQCSRSVIITAITGTEEKK